MSRSSRPCTAVCVWRAPPTTATPAPGQCQRAKRSQALRPEPFPSLAGLSVAELQRMNRDEFPACNNPSCVQPGWIIRVCYAESERGLSSLCPRRLRWVRLTWWTRKSLRQMVGGGNCREIRGTMVWSNCWPSHLASSFSLFSLSLFSLSLSSLSLSLSSLFFLTQLILTSHFALPFPPTPTHPLGTPQTRPTADMTIAIPPMTTTLCCMTSRLRACWVSLLPTGFRPSRAAEPSALAAPS